MNRRLIDILIKDFSVYDRNILDAFKKTDRSLFIPAEYGRVAGQNIAIPLMNGQTSTKPSTIARFLNFLSRYGYSDIIEIGTGSGYQTALLSLLYKKVISYEIDPELYEWAGKRLAAYGNVTLRLGNIFREPPTEMADAVIASFAICADLENLNELIREGGSILAPVLKGNNQFLLHIFKENGKITNNYLNYEHFVKHRGLAENEQ